MGSKQPSRERSCRKANHFAVCISSGTKQAAASPSRRRPFAVFANLGPIGWNPAACGCRSATQTTGRWAAITGPPGRPAREASGRSGWAADRRPPLDAGIVANGVNGGLMFATQSAVPWGPPRADAVGEAREGIDGLVSPQYNGRRQVVLLP